MEKITHKSVVFGTIGKKHFAFLVDFFRVVRITQEDKELFDLYYNKKKTLSDIVTLLEGDYSETREEIFDKFERRIYFAENEGRNYINHSEVKKLFFENIALFDREKKSISKENILTKLKRVKKEDKFGVTLWGFRDTDIFSHPNIKDIAEYCRENDISIEIISKTNTMPPSHKILKFFEDVNTKIAIRAITQSDEFMTEEFLSSLFYFSLYKIKLHIELNECHEKFEMIQEYCLKFNISTATVFYEKEWYPMPV